MRLGVPAVFFASMMLGCSAVSEPDSGLTLTLIHINDTHSQFDASPASVKDAKGQPLYTYIGGHPRLFSHAQTLRQQANAQESPSLFLHGGDAFKGSAYFELFEQKINIDVLNRMQIDAMALGNHEFDIGLNKLADFVDKINFPVLAANINTAAEPLLANSQNLKPYSLFVLDNNQLQRVASVDTAAGRELVAVFGLALEDMRAIAPDTGALVFYNEIQSAQQTVDVLTALGVKHIIALTHLGHQRDLALASAVNGIDAIVGGHSHSLLGDFRHWYLGNQRPYAEMVANPDGNNQTCVVQAGQFAQAVGKAMLTFNRNGQLQACIGENTLLASKDYFNSPRRDESSRILPEVQAETERYIAGLPRTAIVSEDKALRDVLDSTYLPAVQQAYGSAVSVTPRSVNHVRLPGTAGSDRHGSALAGYIADAMVYWLNQPQLQAKTQRTVDFALIGAGNIRAPLAAGTVYEGNVRLEVLPFNTPLSIMSVSGAELAALLTDTISATLVPGAHAGKFPYSGKLRYTAKQIAQGKAQLSQLQLWRDNQWQDIQPEQVYTLATTQYLADGNDGWQVLQQAQQQTSDRLDVILQDKQPHVYAVKRVIASQDSSGAVSYKAEYLAVPALPCKTSASDCKAAAQAFIEYLQANPELWQTPREPTVTLIN
ncbi:bifunctional metallophosphatase/5'-nucleotidase [Rheinheimera baltica]|nr:bifunctional metallophosphatase/5'-nucleotidase [Rheinheimera baltica]MDP5141653.1 bifunctional metallophosphatase/5'-nucleotidase [Rheinheimera baltica]